MSRYDAERALEIYKIFSKQTNLVVEYLATARQFETSTRLEVPKLKHAPTSLTASLEEYLHDPDFEINRRQYLAQQEAKKGRGTANGANKTRATASPRPAQKDAFPPPKPAQPTSAKQEAKGPGPDLIDFFESIEQNQQPMAQPQLSNQQVSQFQQQNMKFDRQPQPYQQHGFPAQPGGLPPQQLNQPQQFGLPFAQQSSAPINQLAQPPVQQNLEAGAYGGYSLTTQPGYSSPSTLSSMPQNNVTPFQPPLPQQQQPQQVVGILGTSQQQTNPFRQSVIPPTNASVSYASSPTVTAPLGRTQGTNPFAKVPPVQQTVSSQGSSPFTTQAPTISPVQIPPQTQAAQPIRPVPVGTNPFSRTSPPQQQQPTAPPPTVSTNPFRQSVFQGQQTGPGWQQGQGTIGGPEQLPTVSTFPRQGESNVQQQQKWM
jgi:hypothetical protein